MQLSASEGNLLIWVVTRIEVRCSPERLQQPCRSRSARLLPRFVGNEAHDRAQLSVLEEQIHEAVRADLDVADACEELVPKSSHDDILAWLGDYSGWFWPPMIQAGDWPTALYGIDGPRKEELDRVVSVRPVILFDDSGHSQWLNSSALDILGVSASTPDPAPGLSYFVRDENGEPTGWVKEFALVPFMGDTLLPSRKEM